MGWFSSFLKMLVTDDTPRKANRGQQARGLIDGRQVVRPGTYVRLLEGEWKGRDAIVETTTNNGGLTVRVQANGRTVRTWEHKVQALRGPTEHHAVQPRRGQECRINRGEWRGRIGTVVDSRTDGTLWVQITGGSNNDRDIGNERGREVKVGLNDVTLIGR